LKELNDAMMQIFKFYCELVWNQYGIDAFPSRYKEIEPDEDIDAFQLWEIVKGGGDFTPEVREEIAERGEYTCENDPSHKTFPDPCGGNYIDVVPIVPFSSYPQFGKSVLSACNGACLCPMCKAQMRYGSRDAREDIIIKLYRKRQQEMEESGMQVSLAQVLSLNSLS
jgi:hypothetical protein